MGGENLTLRQISRYCPVGLSASNPWRRSQGVVGREATRSTGFTVGVERAHVLGATDVTVRFGGVVALDSVSLGVASGEVLGLIGPNGAGKTTLFDVLSGTTMPTAGPVELNGCRRHPPQRHVPGPPRPAPHVPATADLRIVDSRGQRAHRHRVARWRRWPPGRSPRLAVRVGGVNVSAVRSSAHPRGLCASSNCATSMRARCRSASAA